MKYSDNGSPGKTGTSDNQPVKLLVIVLLIVLSPYLITRIKNEAPEALKKYNEYKEAAGMEKQRRDAGAATPPSADKPGTGPKQRSLPGQLETPPASAAQPISTGEVTLSISKHGFLPAKFMGSRWHKGLEHKLQKQPFSEIKKAPKYLGYTQWYGYMDLGNQEYRRFYFVLDLQENEVFVLYFDANKNNDLTDDGPPLINMDTYGIGGFDGFATTVLIPWKFLIQEPPFTGDFNVTFFMNEAGWANGQMASHHSWTQLKQTIRIGEGEYMAVLVDTGYNDADLTNDGIILDLNQNGMIDPNEMPAETYEINGETYKFRIVW